MKLIKKLANFRKDLTFNLYGTDQDKAITQPISNSLKSDRLDACKKKALINFSTAEDFFEDFSLDFFASKS